MFTVSDAEVFFFVQDHAAQDCTIEQIATGIDLAQATVQKKVLNLVRAGVLHRETKPTRVQLAKTPDLEVIVQLQQLESAARSAWRLRGIEPD